MEATANGSANTVCDSLTNPAQRRRALAGEDGEWKMEDGEWDMEDGGWRRNRFSGFRQGIGRFAKGIRAVNHFIKQKNLPGLVAGQFVNIQLSNPDISPWRNMPHSEWQGGAAAPP
jgi:hypothetical protein